MKINKKCSMLLSSTALLLAGQSVFATCADIPRDSLMTAIAAAETASTVDATHHTKLGGYGLPMWATVVDETGKVCHVAVSANGSTGVNASNSEWLASRVISAQKANTANSLSIDGYAISTANLFSAVESGNFFGLQASNPVDADAAYAGAPSAFGTKNDPMKGKRIGGINVFGGGLALYKSGKKVGALGVSGDTSCRDHEYAWQIRGALQMHAGGTGITTVNMNAAGVVQTPLTGATKGDEMILRGAGTSYWEGWAQPLCPNSIATGVATVANGVLLAP